MELVEFALGTTLPLESEVHGNVQRKQSLLSVEAMATNIHLGVPPGPNGSVTFVGTYLAPHSGLALRTFGRCGARPGEGQVF